MQMPCNAMQCQPRPCWSSAPRVQLDSTIIMETAARLESNSSFLTVLSLSLLTSVDSKSERFSSLLPVCTVLCNIRLLIAARYGCKAHYASPEQPGQSSTLTCEPRTADNSSESPVPGTCLIIGRARQSRPHPDSQCSQSVVFLFFFPPFTSSLSIASSTCIL